MSGHSLEAHYDIRRALGEQGEYSSAVRAYYAIYLLYDLLALGLRGWTHLPANARLRCSHSWGFDAPEHMGAPTGLDPWWQRFDALHVMAGREMNARSPLVDAEV